MDDKRERGLVPTLSRLMGMRTTKLHTNEPFDIFCVVADDEKYFRKRVLDELDLIIKQRQDVRVGVAAAGSVEELFNLAFAGNAGLPATMLLLDLALEHQKSLWRIYTSDVMYWMRQLNVQFPITTTGRRVDKDILEHCFDHYNTDGNDVALVLRVAGFSGVIKILSNVGDSDSTLFKHRLHQIQELIPDLNIQTPIVDEVMRKQGFSGVNVIPYPTRPLLSADTSGTGKEKKKGEH